MDMAEHHQAIFPRGERASSDYFTGTAWVNILVPQDETASYAIGNVQFEPRCRNNWHKLPAGQILLITDGNGYYQEKGKPARLLTKGYVVIIPSGVEHWHGAAHAFAMLVSLGGAEQQVKGHVQGNVNVGNDRSSLLSVVTQLLPYIGYPRTLNAIRCINEELPEKDP